MIEWPLIFQGLTLVSVIGFGSRILWTVSRIEHQHSMMWNDYKSRYGIDNGEKS